MYIISRKSFFKNRLHFKQYAQSYSSTLIRCQGKELRITGSVSVDESDLHKAIQSYPFVQWLEKMDRNKAHFNIKEIHIQSVDMFGPNKVGFIKFKADILDADGDKCPGIVFMRGGAVGVLIILRADTDYVLLVTLDSVAASEPAFPSLPAGMLDGNGSFAGVAAREIEEETGLIIAQADLIDLIDFAYGNTYPGMYTSIGGTDEFVRLYATVKHISPTDLMNLQGKLTGLREENEKIKLKVVKLEDLWRSTSDSKALAALTLYTELNKNNLE